MIRNAPSSKSDILKCLVAIEGLLAEVDMQCEPEYVQWVETEMLPAVRTLIVSLKPSITDYYDDVLQADEKFAEARKNGDAGVPSFIIMQALPDEPTQVVTDIKKHAIETLKHIGERDILATQIAEMSCKMSEGDAAKVVKMLGEYQRLKVIMYGPALAALENSLEKKLMELFGKKATVDNTIVAQATAEGKSPVEVLGTWAEACLWVSCVLASIDCWCNLRLMSIASCI